DILFLGGGPAGYQGAIRAAQLGLRTAVVESRDLGGVCLNRGCIPTKTIKASVSVLEHMRRAKEYGLHADDIGFDMGAIIDRKDKIVGLLRNGVTQLFRANGITLIEGHGQLISSSEVKVESDDGTSLLQARKIVIATGSRPFWPEPFLSGTPGILSTDGILDLRSLPASLIIIGGGAVGVEMASILAGLGSRVTIVEMEARILPREDAEMVAYLTRMLKHRRVQILTGITITGLETEPGICVMLSDGRSLSSDAVLITTGRLPNVEGIGIENVGIDPKGPLKVNAHMETKVPGIYAAGDVKGGWLLAHVAFAEGIAAAENAAGKESIMDYRVIPRCVFSTPEYGAVGMSEEEARASFAVECFAFPLKSLGMAQAMGDWEGQVKLIVEKETGQLLGGHVIGEHAADLIAEIALAMKNNIPVQGIVKTIHTHPSLSEAVLETAQAACGQAIHIMPDNTKA
ncbi:MAG: dihydrolipoyl dehydrogenase, partial [Proteobacteria bacterium]|nr:dihydrolipoyl dehydrogenase [Pseudomonadota bacterium]